MPIGDAPGTFYQRDLRVKGDIRSVEAAALSTVRVRDVEAAHASEGVVKRIRNESIIVVMVVSAFVIGFLLFLALL